MVEQDLASRPDASSSKIVVVTKNCFRFLLPFTDFRQELDGLLITALGVDFDRNPKNGRWYYRVLFFVQNTTAFRLFLGTRART
jgi:hypothetical protein